MTIGTMFILTQLPLVFYLAVSSMLSTTYAVPFPIAGSNATSGALLNNTAAAPLAKPAAELLRYPNCVLDYTIDLTIVDDETWPFPDEVSHPHYYGRWDYVYQEGSVEDPCRCPAHCRAYLPLIPTTGPTKLPSFLFIPLSGHNVKGGFRYRCVNADDSAQTNLHVAYVSSRGEAGRGSTRRIGIPL